MANKHKKLKKNLFLIIIVLLILAAAFVFNKMSGHAVLSLEARYNDNQSLDGVLRLSLKKGELIPASSKIIFNTSKEQEEYKLSELINESPVKGGFYIDGQSLSGEGLGYGIEGVKKIYPELSFVLLVSSGLIKEQPEKSVLEKTQENISEVQAKNESFQGNVSKAELSKESSSKNITQEVVEENKTKETPKENKSVEVANKSTEIVKVKKTENKTKETPKENKSEETSKENVKSSEVKPKEEDMKKTEDKITETPKENMKSVVVKPQEKKTDVTKAEVNKSITGNIISGLLNSVSNFFVGLSKTGKVSLEFGNEVKGKVSKGNDFIYKIKQGQSVKILKGSVKFGNKTLPDDSVKLNVLGDEVRVSTDYSETVKGFGKDYIGGSGKELVINLSGMKFKGNELKISLISEGKEIVSLKTLLQKNKTLEVNQTEENISEENSTLSDEEKKVLSHAFGANFSVDVTKSEVSNGRLVLRYELGDYWIEHSYDYEGNVSEALRTEIKKDRINWLKNLADMLASSSQSSKTIEEFDKKKFYLNSTTMKL